MAAPEDVDQWITDVQETSLPVLVLGAVLLWLVVGIPLTIAGALVLLLMFAAHLVSARSLFFPPEPDWPHG